MRPGNQTSEVGGHDSPPLQAENVAVSVVLALAFIIGMPGNLVVIWSIGSQLKSRSSTATLILNLAVADLLVLMTLPVWIYSFADRWVFGVPFCKVLVYIIYSSIYASIFLITALSVERFLAVFRPFALQRWSRQQIFLRVILIIWALAMLLGIQVLPFQNTEEVEGRTQCMSRIYATDGQKLACLVLETLLGFIIPFSIIITCYIYLRMKLRDLSYVSKRKSETLITSVVVAFILCWIPHHVLNLLQISSVLLKLSHPDLSDTLDKVTEVVKNITGALVFLSSCVNPILYTFAARKFRSHIRLTKLVKLFETVGHVNLRSRAANRVGELGQLSRAR
ncbi:hypothetical protein FKM82_003556 [Ascaphus truei]